MDLRFCDNVPQIRPVKPIAHLDNTLEINLPVGNHALAVDLHNLQPPNLVRQADLDLPVQAARAEERGVEGVGAIRGHDDLGLAEVVEAVELVEQLHQRALDLAIRRRSFGEAAAADGVDLVHEDDARLVLLGVAEHLADQAGGLADVLVNDGGGDDYVMLAFRNAEKSNEIVYP